MNAKNITTRRYEKEASISKLPPEKFPLILMLSLRNVALRQTKIRFYSKLSPASRKVYIEVYGCQMNTNDAEVVHGILSKSSDPIYEKCEQLEEADIALIMTCAIRENAENKVWNRLSFINSYSKGISRDLTVGILGCMAERLKTSLLEKSKTVDLVCGPDAYRDLPNLLRGTEADRDTNINVALSIDETYADINPVRLDSSKKSAFVSIMRGCNNMCSFCIVPFVRGRERSRPMESIVDEVKRLADNGIKEITLLGQNVNSYCDETIVASTPSSTYSFADGFTSVFKTIKQGARFTDLLEKVANSAPKVRFRFTSPHPKDFPDPLLFLIRDTGNICKQIHLPAQSGSTEVLARMRRGYSGESYLNLVDRVKEVIPTVALSSDFISGFVGETEDDHQKTLDLMKKVKYDMAYMYAYSMREKTMAHRRYTDNVPEETKQRRLREVIDCFYESLKESSLKYVGTTQLVMIEGSSKKDSKRLCGRTDGNRKVVLDKEYEDIKPGDFVEVHISSVSSTTLVGSLLKNNTI